MHEENEPTKTGQLFAAAVAAFCTYFCMYAFRKPFTAATFDGQEMFGLDYKGVLIIAQIFGYMLSKFIGIRVVSEMRREYRAATIVGLILFGEAALVGFAYLPPMWKIGMLFLNGLPLGMVFGLVLAYLEGRKQTEALSAVLCASFIVSSGVVKSVGRWLLDAQGVDEHKMPMIAGALFLTPLFVSVWVLSRTPPPDASDRLERRERPTIDRAERRRFLATYLPGIVLLVAVYVSLTVVRTIRDDFGVEIWRELGVEKKPEVFATSETIVAMCVTALSAVAICIHKNLTAIRWSVWLMCAGFALVTASALAQSSGVATPLAFMVASGIGLYVPYVLFHTTIFERIIAASTLPSNLGFLMYVADAMGYLGYSGVVVVKSYLDYAQEDVLLLPAFRTILFVSAAGSIAALITAYVYLRRKLDDRHVSTNDDRASESAR